MKDRRDTCKNCKFGTKRRFYTFPGNTAYECRRLPISSMKDPEFWCGEFSERDETNTTIEARQMKAPNDIDILLHYYTTPGDHPRIDAPAVIESIQNFREDGILTGTYGEVSVVADKVVRSKAEYRITKKGRVWLSMILNTPYPIKKWCTPNGEAIRRIK